MTYMIHIYLVSFIYLVYLFVTLGLFCFTFYPRKKISRAVVFSSRPFPNILKYRDHW